MAEKKSAPSEEKIFTIPLRRVWIKAARVGKTKKSVSAVKEYVRKHTHASEVRMSQKLNETLWAGGAKKPLHTIRVKVSVSEGVADTKLPEEITLEDEKKKFLEKGKKEAEKKAKEQLKGEGGEKAPEEKEEEQKPEDKPEEKPKGEPKPEENKEPEKK